MGSDHLHRENAAIEELRIQKLQLLMKLTAQINSRRELGEILKEIMNAAKIIMEAEASSLLIYDPEADELILSVPTGPATAVLSNKRFPTNKGISGWVFTNNQTQVVTNVPEDPRFYGDVRSDLFVSKNMICVPMRNQEGVVIGALQAINTPFAENGDEQAVQIFESLANQAAIAITNARLQEDKLAQELLLKELALAYDIQRGFWPKKTPKTAVYDISGSSIPASMVGGDYYDFISVPGTSKIVFVVADVAGKGMPAALLMASVRSAIRAYAEQGMSPKTVMELVNKAVYRDSPTGIFITMCYVELDTETHTLTYCSAGHHPPLLLDRAQGRVETLQTRGIMLGILPDATYDCQTSEISPGQKVVIFSDGIIEAQNKEGDFFGEERLREWVRVHAHENANELQNGIQDHVMFFQLEAPQYDDMTVVVFQRDK